MKEGDYTEYQNMSRCESCGETNFPKRMRLFNPCPKCGGNVVGDIGRWKCTDKSPLWKFWETDFGVIELKNKQ